MIERPEAERNRRLRRVDWRFLFGRPKLGRVYARAGADLTDAVASLAGEIVTEGASGDCDVAIAENPAARTLDELYSALRPGGACYVEWQPRLGRAARMNRALGETGFTDIVCYRRCCGVDGLPLYWLPLGAPGAAAYVRSRLRLPGGRVRRLIAETLRRLRLLARGRRSTLSFVAYRPGGISDEGLSPAQWIAADWPSGEVGPAPERLSTLLATGGPRSVSKVVLLAFDEPDPVPRVAVKMARIDRAAVGLRREAAALERLAASERPQGVPRLLFLREADGFPVVGETAIEGRPLDRLLERANFRAWSVKVTDWLSSLAAVSRSRSASEWGDTLVEPALAEFVQRFGSVADPGLLRDSTDIVRAIGGLPIVPEQRDFGPWNLFATPSGELAVLDWESARIDGLPCLDLLYYLAYASFNVDGAHDRDARLEAYRRSLDPSTPTGAVRRECLTRYAGALGLAEEQLTPLHVLLWLLHAPSEFHHAAADAGGSPAASALADSLFVALWAEEVRRLAPG